MDSLLRIKNKLEKASLFKDNIFGVEEHDLKIRSALSEENLRDFECLYSVTLPSDYRNFLLVIGNGGAGPGYGMCSLEEGLSYYRDVVPKDIISRPFDHIGSYTTESDPKYIQLEQDCDDGKLSEQEIEQEYIYANSGTIVLSHEGCGYLHRLVVNGPEKGIVWMDAEVSDQGYSSMNVKFIDWYEKWLDDVLSGGSGSWWFRGR